MKSYDRFGVTEEQLRALVAEGLRDGGDWCDLYFEDTSYHDLLLRDGVVGSGGYHVDFGCGIRVLKGEKTGYAYAETTDFASLKSAARAAASIAVNAGCGTSGPQNFASLHGSQLPKTSGDAGPLPLPSEAGPSLLRSRGWLRFSEAVAVSTTPAAAVSSTKIRKALEEGRVEEAEAMLGYAYGLRGVVVSGKQLGRTLGFPTANLRLYDPMKLVPARGVYLTEVEVLGGHYWGMTNVGDIIETHIFDFSEDIYGLDLEIRFRRWLRAMRNMASLDALKTQLAADEAACRELLKSI